MSVQNGTKPTRSWQKYAENLQRSREKVREALGAREHEPTVMAAERVASSGRRLGSLVVEICDVLDMPVTARCEELVARVRRLKDQSDRVLAALLDD